jgi:hypothetical protein
VLGIFTPPVTLSEAVLFILHASIVIPSSSWCDAVNVSCCANALNIGVYEFFKLVSEHFTGKHISLSFGSSGVLPIGRLELPAGSIVRVDPFAFFLHGLAIQPGDIPSAGTMTHDAGVKDCPFNITGLCSGCIEVKL